MERAIAGENRKQKGKHHLGRVVFSKRKGKNVGGNNE